LVQQAVEDLGRPQTATRSLTARRSADDANHLLRTFEEQVYASITLAGVRGRARGGVPAFSRIITLEGGTRGDVPRGRASIF
jgi:hypothetical protein